MPKRNKLSQRRLEYKRKQKAWMVQQRQKAWMVHQMIDEDLKNYKEMYSWMIGLGFPDHYEQRSNISRSKNTGTVSVGEILSDATLLISTAAYQSNVSINFEDAYPTSLAGLEFNISATDVEYLEATASFTYRKYSIIDLV